MNQLQRVCSLIILAAIGVVDGSALAQSRTGRTPSSVLPSGGGQALIDPSDTVILLLDHQAGLFQTVKDISVSDLRANTMLMAKVASLLKIPASQALLSQMDRTDR